MGRIRLKPTKQGVAPVDRRSTVQQTSGFGYVIIPEGVDRDQFVETCFRKNRISIVDDSNGNVIHDCYITNEALQNIKFPRVVGEKGIPVVWTSQPMQTEPMIIGTFTPINNITIRDDEEIDVTRAWDQGLLSIKGSAKDGSLFITLRGDTAPAYIKVVVDGSEDAILEAESSGSIKATANKNIDVKAFTELTAKVIDPTNKNESGIKVNKDEITVSSVYGEEDSQNTFKTTVTTAGVVTDVAFNGGNSYNNTIDANKALIQYEDSLVQLEKNKATFKQGEAYIELADGKVAFINTGTGLNELLTKIVDTIATLKVYTAMGPSGLPLPDTIAKTTELNQLLKLFFNK